MPAPVPVQPIQPIRYPGMFPDVVRTPWSDPEDIPVIWDGPTIPLAALLSGTGTLSLPFVNLS